MRMLDRDSQIFYLLLVAYIKLPAHRKVENLNLARHLDAAVSHLLSPAIAFALGVALLSAPAAEAKESRYAAIVMEADTGTVLSATNPDRHSYPASLTKMMTLFLVFDALEAGRLKLDTPLAVSGHASVQAPSKLGLRPGEHIAVQDLVLALVTKSANDAAVVAAEALGGTEANFAQMMTRKAHALGMADTTYHNASGLPDRGQMSTPRDQARLARALIRDHAKYYHYFATRQFEWRGQVINSHNHLLGSYPGADGIKTGYINASGFNLVASAIRDGHRLIGVVFGGDSIGGRDRRMVQLLDQGFAHIGRASKGTEMVEAGDDEPAAAAAAPKTMAQLVLAADKVKVAPAPVPEAKDSADVKDDAEAMGDEDPATWAIQVGAFAGYKPAHHAAAAAAKTLGGLASNAEVDIDKRKAGRHTVFRARLTGFTEDQARAACRKLGKSKHECHVVQPTA